MPKKTQSGFTLIEVIITAAVMAIVAIGAMQMSTNSLKSQKGVTDSSDLNTFATSLQQLMGAQATCTAMLTANPGVNHVGAANPRAVRFNVTGVTAAPRTDLQETGLEIDYPMPAVAPATGIVPNPANRLIRSGDVYKGWNVAAEANAATHINPSLTQGMGIHVKSQAGSNTSYYVSLLVNFQKNTDASGNALSSGSQLGQRESGTLLVTTTAPDASGNVTVQACGSVAGAASSSSNRWVFLNSPGTLITLTNPGTATANYGPAITWTAPRAGSILITMFKAPFYVFSCAGGHIFFTFSAGTLTSSNSNTVAGVENLNRFVVGGVGGAVTVSPSYGTKAVAAGDVVTIQRGYIAQYMTACSLNTIGNAPSTDMFTIDYIN